MTRTGVIPRATADEAAYIEKQIGKESWLLFFHAMRLLLPPTPRDASAILAMLRREM